MPEAGVVILIGFILFFIWLLPFIFILKSKKTEAEEKLAWAIAVFLFWPLCILYMLVAPVKKKTVVQRKF
ncbi:hypothetical protein [Pleionea sp. CnH1-48]|uniref:hypothetical protein n=1 Tax=Pleionea sp. CnH1-48 TaxID=2954494 RepID=UPI002097C5FB|nr:hypothetical protein [Pleionea sp. CnH1-48]MCO7222738.1 hypothetical protein [Pleionea sp. CnH1-48]